MSVAMLYNSGFHIFGLPRPYFSLFSICSAIVVSNENSSIHIDAVIDPLSPSGQKLSSILRVLSKYIQPSMRIILNPLVSCLNLVQFQRVLIVSILLNANDYSLIVINFLRN